MPCPKTSSRTLVRCRSNRAATASCGQRAGGALGGGGGDNSTVARVGGAPGRRARSLTGPANFLAPRIVAWVESGPLTTGSLSPMVLLRAAAARSLTLALLSIAVPVSSVAPARAGRSDRQLKRR